MVTTTDVEQLSKECDTWIDTLRSFRDQFIRHKSRLQLITVKQISRDELLEIEHLHNQFHIQLINIHDLKQEIKLHRRKISIEKHSKRGNIADEILARHEKLLEDYHSQENTLRTIDEEFEQFIAQTR